MIVKSLLAVWLAGFACLSALGNPTAYQLAKLANQYVGVQSKGKVVQIRSKKSIASLTPDIWYVVLYDPDATFKAIQVKFGAGEKMDVSRPGRFLELFGEDKTPLESRKLVIDSDQAIKIAVSQPLLKNLVLKSTQLWLEHGDLGPQWRVKLWAATLKDPNKSADIGLVILTADDGTIVKLDLHPESVD